MKANLIKLIAIIFSFFIGFACNDSGRDKESLKIGAILPLTGDLASYGVDTKRSIDLALKQYNEKGGILGKKIELVIEDSQGKTESATKAINKLITIDKVIAILGPLSSQEVLAIAPIANKNKIPIISPSSTDNSISMAGEYIFRTINADYVENQAFSNYIKNNYNFKGIAIIANEATGTLSYANSFEKFYKYIGGIILIEEIFPENQKDFKSIIYKILKHKPDAIYISGYSTEIGLLIKQIREYNNNIQILSYQSAEDPRVVDIAGEAVNGVIYSTTSLPDKLLGGAKEKFNADFQNEYSKKPGIFSSEIYDALNIIIKSQEDAQRNKIELIETLKNIKNFRGASGNISFDEYGDVHKGIAICEYVRTIATPKFLVLDNMIEVIK